MYKPKNGSARASSRVNQDLSSAQLLPRSEALAALAAMGPVSSTKDAYNWVESKGFILAGEQYTKPKLADILFTVAMDAKIPSEVKSAIIAVAFLIEDLSEDDFSASIADKIINRIEGTLSNLNTEVGNTEKFLAATSTQQAEATLAFQKAVDTFSGNIDKLTKASDKVVESIGNHQWNPPDTNWPQLEPGNVEQATQSNPLNFRSFALSASQAKVQQCTLLAAKQLYVSTGPKDNKAPSSRTIEDQRKLRDSFVRWLSDKVKLNVPDFNNPRAIRGVKILNHFDVLLEFDTEASLVLFKTRHCHPSKFLSISLHPSTSILSYFPFRSLQRGF
jgi:hypothetical protein